MQNYICNVLGTLGVYLLTNKRIFICNMHNNHNIETLRSKKLVLIRDGCEGQDCNILHTYALNIVVLCFIHRLNHNVSRFKLGFIITFPYHYDQFFHATFWTECCDGYTFYITKTGNLRNNT